VLELLAPLREELDVVLLLREVLRLLVDLVELLLALLLDLLLEVLRLLVRLDHLLDVHEGDRVRRERRGRSRRLQRLPRGRGRLAGAGLRLAVVRSAECGGDERRERDHAVQKSEHECWLLRVAAPAAADVAVFPGAPGHRSGVPAGPRMTSG